MIRCYRARQGGSHFLELVASGCVDAAVPRVTRSAQSHARVDLGEPRLSGMSGRQPVLRNLWHAAASTQADTSVADD